MVGRSACQLNLASLFSLSLSSASLFLPVVEFVAVGTGDLEDQLRGGGAIAGLNRRK